MAVPDPETLIPWVGAILSTPLAVKLIPKLVRGILETQKAIYEPLHERVAKLEAKLVQAEEDCDRRIAVLEERIDLLRRALWQNQAVLARHGITPPDGNPKMDPAGP